MVHQMPANFSGKSRLEKFARSLFSRSEDAQFPYPSQLKIPFMVYISELKAFGSPGPDTRVGGFGPLFSGILIYGFLLGLATGFCQKKKIWPMAQAMAIVFLTILVNPECWWSRFAPQTWVVPFIVIHA